MKPPTILCALAADTLPPLDAADVPRSDDERDLPSRAVKLSAGIARVRKETADRKTPWTHEELKALGK